MKQLTPNINGLLEVIQETFFALDKQEKRALSLFRKREEELIKTEEDEDEGIGGRSLKKVEIYDKLQNDTLRVINDNNRAKIELAKVYGTFVVNKEKDGPPNNNNSELTQKDMDYLRQYLSDPKFK